MSHTHSGFSPVYAICISLGAAHNAYAICDPCVRGLAYPHKGQGGLGSPAAVDLLPLAGSATFATKPDSRPATAPAGAGSDVGPSGTPGAPDGRQDDEATQ